jgi:hypothetical protein
MNRATELNFIERGAPISWWRALLLLAALAMLLGWGQRWSQQNQRNQQLQSELAQIQPVAALPVARSAAEQQELETRARVIGEAVRQLNLPVASLFKTLQAPKDVRVALLGVDLNAKPGAVGVAGNATANSGNSSGNSSVSAVNAGANPGAGSSGNNGGNSGGNSGGGVLKIQAEAPNPQQMMAYVAFLDEQPLFKSVYLIKHEVTPGSNGEAQYRFLLEAQWRQ